MWKKFGRNAGILIGFCLALVLLVQLGNWLMKNRTAAAATDRLTESRHRADELFQAFDRSRYFQPQRTISLYDIVLEDDPDNGGALYRRAITYRRWYRATVQQDENNTTLLKELSDKAFADFQRLMDFPRFRNLARHSISMLHAHLGNHDEALKYLREAFESGYVSEGNNFYNHHLAAFYYKAMKEDPAWNGKLRRLQGMELRNFGRRGGG